MRTPPDLLCIQVSKRNRETLYRYRKRTSKLNRALKDASPHPAFPPEIYISTLVCTRETPGCRWCPLSCACWHPRASTPDELFAEEVEAFTTQTTASLPATAARLQEIKEAQKVDEECSQVRANCLQGCCYSSTQATVCHTRHSRLDKLWQRAAVQCRFLSRVCSQIWLSTHHKFAKISPSELWSWTSGPFS